MRFVHARADDRMCTCGFWVQSDDEFDRHLDERRVSAVENIEPVLDNVADIATGQLDAYGELPKIEKI